MLVKLTNANKLFNGETILINTDMVLSIYEGYQMDENNNPTDTKATIVFVPQHGSWEVKETPEQIYALIDKE